MHDYVHALIGQLPGLFPPAHETPRFWPSSARPCACSGSPIRPKPRQSASFDPMGRAPMRNLPTKPRTHAQPQAHAIYIYVVFIILENTNIHVEILGEICSTRGLQNTTSWIVCFLYEFSQSTDLDEILSQPTDFSVSLHVTGGSD